MLIFDFPKKATTKEIRHYNTVGLLFGVKDSLSVVIKKYMIPKTIVAGVLMTLGVTGYGQTKISAFERKFIDRGLVDVQKLDPTLKVELKYSTTDNFIKEDVYGDLERAYLQPMAAEKLVKANKFLKQEKPNYTLLVYDGARPRSVTKIFWARMSHLPYNRREDFVADPARGSIHNFGCAVDLTIADEKGQPLDMGTIFDFFGELAEPRRETAMLKSGKLTKQQLENRKLLRRVMIKAGYTSIQTEWWHYNAMSREKAKVKYGFIE
ncbi:M15 family metallopeptidase [Runella salmonicolor]|uniref:D-alanyl-D-alanine dipeptidase n=1 Tax=Runella salmonicolor TaxID=2950278 RepID=A0ABT1FXH3_9BACT|nr:M15 family metallopeptidase [Runella salmonicolor]MCP1385438.1 M15 family metallopeptidase [Runella salmonicolor]